MVPIERTARPNQGAALLKVLWVARLLPAPADSGDRLYTRGLAASLGGAGAKVSVLGLVDPAATVADLDTLPSTVEWRAVPGRSLGRLRTLASLMPLEAKRFATAVYDRALRQTLEAGAFDVVVLDHYSAVWALPRVRKAGLPVAIVAHNFETALSRSIAEDYRGDVLKKRVLSLNADRTRRAERRLAETAGLVVTITDADAAAFRNLGAARTLTLTPGYDGAPADLDRPLSPERRVVLLGSYRWVAKQMNLRAFLQLADPRFAAAGVTLDVVGEIPETLRAEFAGRLRATRLHGYVDDPATIMSSARIGVVPEATGGGFKLKILDYIFAGLPVAALAAALEGLPDDVRRHTLSWNSLEQLVDGICSCIGDDRRLLDLRRGAQTQSLNAFDWGTRGAAMLAALEALASSPS